MTVFHTPVRSASSQMAGSARLPPPGDTSALPGSFDRSRAPRSRRIVPGRAGLAVVEGLDNRRLGVAEVLFGRSSELKLISAFAERAAAGGEALLLFGEAGAGKTVLLDAAAQLAPAE